jgi:hypothetical protein
VNSSGVPFPNSGLDLELGWKPNDLFFLHGGVYQDNTDSTTTSLGHLSADHLLWLAEFVIRPSPGGRQGNYRFLAY